MSSAQPTATRSGVLLVDKPVGMSSADVTNKIKRAHRFARIGHGGTLDPFATGLMVVLLGEGTKIARFLLEGQKEYIADAQLGSETETGDPEGAVTETGPTLDWSVDQWSAVAKNLTGRITQIPPIYSAIKLQGRPLYDYARKGEAVEAKPREVYVKALEVLSATPNLLRFRVECSGGTYVRTLALDLARAAGTRAHLTALHRTGSSSFRVENAWPLARVLETPTAELPLLGLVEAVAHLPRVECDLATAQKIRQGNLAAFDRLKNLIEKPGYFLVLTRENGREIPVAIANHHPMLIPVCSIERVFDPLAWQS